MCVCVTHDKVFVQSHVCTCACTTMYCPGCVGDHMHVHTHAPHVHNPHTTMPHAITATNHVGMHALASTSVVRRNASVCGKDGGNMHMPGHADASKRMTVTCMVGDLHRYIWMP